MVRSSFQRGAVMLVDNIISIGLQHILRSARPDERGTHPGVRSASLLSAIF
jgi:hypothetical protein